MDVVEHQQSSSDFTSIVAIQDTVRSGSERRVGSPHDEGNMSPPPKPNRAHVRPLSFAARNGNRLSLSFPIQLPDKERGGSNSTAPSSSASLSSLYSPTKIVASMPSPKDSTSFMVALAAQERRVLELKEELNRAEFDLKKLKRQWALHEGSKKRSDIKHVEQLCPVYMSTSGTNSVVDDIENTVAARRSSELDRRKALHASLTKDSRRKIITGGHTRTLSLLSTDRASYDGFTSSNCVNIIDRETNLTNPAAPLSPFIPGSSHRSTKTSSNRTRHSYHDNATNGVKQIAEDIKAGLWTFMEDLRQATVGDEAIQKMHTETPAGLVSSSSVVKSRIKESIVGTDKSRLRSESTSKGFEHGKRSGLASSEKCSGHASPTTRLQTPKPFASFSISPEFDDDDWGNWDSPISKGASPRWSNSTTISSQHTVASSIASPLTDLKAGENDISVQGTPKREEISWPALNNITPSNLKMTASAIMKEWEKTLTPSPENRSNLVSVSLIGKKLESDQEARLLLSYMP